MKKISDTNLPLSYDPDENKRMENELLQLKLKAELGVEAHISPNTPASIENIFLKNMLAFEKGLAEAEETNIYKLIGRPDFIPEAKIDDFSVEAALNKIMDLLNEKQIALDFLGTYDGRTKYKFITEELFKEKVMNVQLPGMIMHFIYEEFHPNHKLDIEHKAAKFINAWISQEKEQLSFSLADALVLEDRRIWKKGKIMDRFVKVFDSYSQFHDCNYTIADINFEIKEDIGLGYAEGYLKYTALAENHEEIQFEGPFKLYFTLEYEWWSIYYFVIPGFEFTDE
jgi:hypothetical protein